MSKRIDSIETLNLELYHHSFKGRVKTFEVDRQNIVHNVIYLYWIEQARVEYFRALGLLINDRTFIDHHRFVIASTEIIYHAPLFFDAEYEVLTRISAIGASSCIFDHVIVHAPNSHIIAQVQSVLVQLQPHAGGSQIIDKEYRGLVTKFEGIDFMGDV